MKTKFFFLFVIFFLSLICSAQEIKFRSASDTLQINGFSFVFKIKRSYNEFLPMEKDTVLLIYRLEAGKEKLLVKHSIHVTSADCNNIFTDYGKVELSGSKLILTTKYTQQGHDPIPDFRKRIYGVNAKGQLILVSDKEGSY
jgi:hypothetical protein